VPPGCFVVGADTEQATAASSTASAPAQPARIQNSDVTSSSLIGVAGKL
jgi:hypothetical protein